MKEEIVTGSRDVTGVVSITGRRIGCVGFEINTSVVRQKSLYFFCHSGLDPESSFSELDSRFRGNDGLGITVRKKIRGDVAHNIHKYICSIAIGGQVYLISISPFS